jgi:hypothetical protein
MYIISIRKIESRRSGTDRRQSDISKSIVRDKRRSKDRRSSGDRRNMSDRRSCVYRIISDQQKEKLDKIINVHHEDGSDLVIG